MYVNKYTMNFYYCWYLWWDKLKKQGMLRRFKGRNRVIRGCEFICMYATTFYSFLSARKTWLLKPYLSLLSELLSQIFSQVYQSKSKIQGKGQKYERWSYLKLWRSNTSLGFLRTCQVNSPQGSSEEYEYPLHGVSVYGGVRRRDSTGQDGRCLFSDRQL